MGRNPSEPNQHPLSELPDTPTQQQRKQTQDKSMEMDIRTPSQKRRHNRPQQRQPIHIYEEQRELQEQANSRLRQLS